MEASRRGMELKSNTNPQIKIYLKCLRGQLSGRSAVVYSVAMTCDNVAVEMDPQMEWKWPWNGSFDISIIPPLPTIPSP